MFTANTVCKSFVARRNVEFVCGRSQFYPLYTYILCTLHQVEQRNTSRENLCHFHPYYKILMPRIIHRSWLDGILEPGIIIKCRAFMRTRTSVIHCSKIIDNFYAHSEGAFPKLCVTSPGRRNLPSGVSYLLRKIIGPIITACFCRPP